MAGRLGRKYLTGRSDSALDRQAQCRNNRTLGGSPSHYFTNMTTAA